MKFRITITVLLGLALTAGALAQNVATTRDAAIDVEVEPPKLSRVENDDIKRARAYPMQPPTVPHKIDNYQVDTNANKCLSCHSRRRTQESQAPMVSVTHYMDRDGNFLADVSPRRYFCNQCHVVQRDVKPLLDNDFEDIDELLRADRN
ncbi:MAG: nitrate reductase cytochrome c-type subunit [Halioglobus sp.]